MEAKTVFENNRADADAEGVGARPPFPLEPLDFSPQHFVRLLDRSGLIGTWTWCFTSHEEVWSGAMYRMFGLAPSERPSYELFLARVHPAERAALPSAAEVRAGLGCAEATVRVFRSDGTQRFVSVRIEVAFHASGRPRNVLATIVDVTESETIRRIVGTQLSRQRAADARFGLVRYAWRTGSPPDIAPDPDAFFDLEPGAFAADAYSPIVANEREHWRSLDDEAGTAGRVSVITPTLRLAGREPIRYRSWGIPIYDASGVVVERCGLSSPAMNADVVATDQLRRGAEQAVRGHHFRAARTLLGLSMMNFAEASGLSFSTIRRLEENGEAPNANSRHKAVAALRAGGIRFTLLGNGAVAVSRR